MASYVEIPGKLDWALAFQRTGKFPLDRSSMFESYADAVLYAAGAGDDSRALGGSSYVGQIITVYENDVVTVYKINADRTLGEVGRATSGDNKSITLNDEGILALTGFDAATNGMQLRVKVDAETSEKSLEWYTPDTSTVDGLAATLNALVATVGKPAEGEEEATGMVKDIADLKVDVASINTKLTGALHYKGSCAFADLPVASETVTVEVGDVWNVTDAGGTDAHGQEIHAGDNVIWNGTGWDVSTGVIDLSAYSNTEQVDAKIDALKTDLEAKIDEVANAATQVEASETNGNIKVDGNEVTVYTLPIAGEETVGGIKVAAAGTADKVVLDENGVASIAKVSADKVDGVVDEAAKVTHTLKMGEKTFDGSADVTFTSDDIPLPTKVVTNETYGTDTVAGAVKSSAEKDQIAIGTDGKMNLNTVSATKIDGVVDEAAKVTHTLTMGEKTFDGSADVTFTTDDLPLPDNLVKKTDLATEDVVGLVKGSTEKDKVAVAEDGTMKLNTVSADKIDGTVAKAADADKLGGIAAADVFVADSETNLTSQVKSAAAAVKLKEAQDITLSGDVTGTAKFDGSAAAEITATLADTGVTAGKYAKVTVDSKGRVTAGEALTAEDIPEITLDKVTDAGALAAKDKVARTDIDADFEAQVAELETKAHTHENKTVLDGISTAKVTAWDAAATAVDGKADKATTLAGYGIEDAYTKAEVDGKLSSVLHYKGTVDTYDELPVESDDVTIEVGDVYNVATAGGTDSQGTAIKAGDNVAWNGTGWDVLAGTVDLSAYDTRAQAEEKLAAAKTELQSNIDAATDRLDTLESTVGDADSGLVKDVAALKTSEATQNTKIADLETVVGKAATDDEIATGLVKVAEDNTREVAELKRIVGHSELGLVKDVADLQTAVETLNGDEETEGSVAKTVQDAVDVVDTKVDTKQDKVIYQTVTVTTDMATECDDSEPGNYKYEITVTPWNLVGDYKADVTPIIADASMNKAVVAATFMPMAVTTNTATEEAAGTLTVTLYSMNALTVEMPVAMTLTKID